MPRQSKYDYEQIKAIIRANRGLKRYQLAQMCGCGANTIRACIAEIIGERNKQYVDELERAKARFSQAEQAIMHRLDETGEELRESYGPHDQLSGYYDGLKFALDVFRRFE